MVQLISISVGAFITWIVSKYYYEKAGNELKKETEILRYNNWTLARFLSNNLDTKDHFKIDEDGRMHNVVCGSITFHGSSNMKAKGTIVKGTPED